MFEVIRLCFRFLVSVFRYRVALKAENLVLRPQLCVYQRNVKRPKVQPANPILWSFFARVWADWRQTLVFVKPETAIRWQRKRFREHRKRLSRSGDAIYRRCHRLYAHPGCLLRSNVLVVPLF